jgi:hypothetical protein
MPFAVTGSMFRGATDRPKTSLPFGSVAGAVVAAAVDGAPAAVGWAPAAVDAGAVLLPPFDELLHAAATSSTAPARITPPR